MTFGVWHERDSGKAGGGGEENVGDFLERESSKVRCEAHFVSHCGVPFKREIFLMNVAIFNGIFIGMCSFRRKLETSTHMCI